MTDSTNNPRILGAEGCHGGVFVYKNDSRVEAAWEAVNLISDKQMIRGELHTKRQEFLDGLRDWNTRLENDNAYLCIYAHMGPLGINCFGSEDATAVVRNGTRITWSDLAACFQNRFEMTWLLGCKSRFVLDQWKACQPAKFLFVTSESKNFVDLLQHLAAEISFNPIIPYDRMPGHLARSSPLLAKHTSYFESTDKGYKKVFTK